MQEETGIEPKALKDRPELSDRWQYPMEVFRDLGGSRRYTSDGPANIPVSEFDCYARGYGFTSQDWIEVWEDLQMVDTFWLSAVNEKRRKQQKGT